jgi:hypothetical protein
MFDQLYSDPARLQQFMNAMTGASMSGFYALAEAFDFSQHQTLCDVGGATGQLAVIFAGIDTCTASPSTCRWSNRWPGHHRSCRAHRPGDRRLGELFH